MMFNYGNPTQVTPYFTVKGRDLAVNVFKSLPYETDINFLSEQSNDAKLSVENIPEGVDIYIVNNADGSEFLLNEGEFSFTADQGSNAEKYKIKFVSKKSALEDVVSSNITVFNDNRQVSISGNSLQNVEVINTLGQVVYNKNVSGDNFNFKLNAQAGTYIVKVVSANGKASQKIIIK